MSCVVYTQTVKPTSNIAILQNSKLQDEIMQRTPPNRKSNQTETVVAMQLVLQSCRRNEADTTLVIL